VSAVNDRHVTMRVLEAAIRRRCPQAGLLHHSDQGSTHTRARTTGTCSPPTASRAALPPRQLPRHAAMESWFSTVKFELGEEF
jgi:transposase InsO family protein